MRFSEKLGAFVLGVGSLLGAEMAHNSNEKVEPQKPSATRNEQKPASERVLVHQDTLPPLVDAAHEDENMENEGVDEGGENYVAIKDALKSQLPQCREMPVGMELSQFYKTLNPGDTFMYRGSDGSLVLERFVAPQDSIAPAQTEKILGVTVETNDDGSKEYVYASGISFQEKTEDGEEEHSLSLQSETDPSSEQMDSTLQKYLTAEKMFRSIDVPLDASHSSDQKMATLQERSKRLEDFMKFCDSKDENGNPRMSLDSSVRNQILSKNDQNTMLAGFMRGQG